MKITTSYCIKVDLNHKTIHLPENFRVLNMSKAMCVSKLYQCLATFEYLSDNAIENLSQEEMWNIACQVRNAMDEKSLTEEEAFEEVCPGLIVLN